MVRCPEFSSQKLQNETKKKRPPMDTVAVASCLELFFKQLLTQHAGQVY